MFIISKTDFIARGDGIILDNQIQPELLESTLFPHLRKIERKKKKHKQRMDFPEFLLRS